MEIPLKQLYKNNKGRLFMMTALIDKESKNV
jgi:hypothetical protein